MQFADSCSVIRKETQEGAAVLVTREEVAPPQKKATEVCLGRMPFPTVACNNSGGYGLFLLPFCSTVHNWNLIHSKSNVRCHCSPDAATAQAPS